MKSNLITKQQNRQTLIFRIIITLTLLSILVLNAFIILAQDNPYAMAGAKSTEHASDKTKDQHNYYYEKGVLEMEENNLNGARKYFNRSISSNPQDALSFDGIGQIFAKTENYRKAIENFDKAIELSQNNAQFYYNRALAETHLDKIEQAILDCDQAIKINPGYAEAYLVRGISRALVGENESSMEDLKKATTLKECYGEAYYNIGLNYYELRDDTNARINFLKADELGYKIENLDAYLKK